MKRPKSQFENLHGPKICNGSGADGWEEKCDEDMATFS